MNLQSLRTVLLDGDGVIWRADEVVPGALDFFAVLEQRGIEWALLTNNNTRTVADFVAKLRRFGIDGEPGRVFTSCTVTADFLRQRYGPGAAVHAVGMDGLLTTLLEAGFCLSSGETPPPHPVAAVVAGMDRAITHDKVKVAMRLILGGADFMATNSDPYFPTPDGLNPGTGMIVAMLKTVTGVPPIVMGKPEAPLYQMALKHLQADAATTVMVGDQLITDILGAQRLGLGGILVLSGAATRAELAQSPIRPDMVFEDLGEMAAALRAIQELQRAP
jgi:4-nitrophenyl phosphatase